MRMPDLMHARPFARLLFVLPVFFLPCAACAAMEQVLPVLQFPAADLDDPAQYRGYATRFFRDTSGNTVQITINRNSGRVGHIWADAANESLSFTARDAAGQPASLTWDTPGAAVSADGKTRFIQYTLAADISKLDLGFFLLGTMRLEREFQYLQRHIQPFSATPFIAPELTSMIERLQHLPDTVRHRHLALLDARNLGELRSRLLPRVTARSASLVLIEQSTFDGKFRLSLQVAVDGKRAAIDVSQDRISIRALHGEPIRLSITIGTDSLPLTPVPRHDIFNSRFLDFYARAVAQQDGSWPGSGGLAKNERGGRFKRLKRQVLSMELLTSEEKLLAGLPNYATYFGRDMMMAALMLEPLWTPAMLEHVIASVLKKVSATGEVSHEEGLGGQAIREHAAEYSRLITAYLQAKKQAADSEANTVLAIAEGLLSNMQAVTENYRMLDDDFQLPVLVSGYIARADIPQQRKRDFLQAAAGQEAAISRLSVIMRNLQYVANISHAYVQHPVTENLIGFHKRDAQHWHAGSWRDSAVGYANGRYAMDINVIWVPNALEAMTVIFDKLRELGMAIDDADKAAPDDAKLRIEYALNPEILRRATHTWRSSSQHFEVHLEPKDVRQRLREKLDWLPAVERAYWESVLATSGADQARVEFLALSLDANGKPIPVVNTDIATWFFLEDVTADILSGEMTAHAVLQRLRVFVLPYPAGLFVAGVGPVVANDAYAPAAVWNSFTRDFYHSPRVVWGREINLLMLGLARQILAAYDAKGHLKEASLEGYVRELRAILGKINKAVSSSGLR